MFAEKINQFSILIDYVFFVYKIKKMNCSNSLFIILYFHVVCHMEAQPFKRFFSENSFWNTPIEKNTASDPRSNHVIKLLEKDENKEIGFCINTSRYTIPVYEADYSIPFTHVNQRYLTIKEVEKINWYKQHPNFAQAKKFNKNVPIPKSAIPDPFPDAHMVIIDSKKNIAWDMWAVKIDSFGIWSSFSAVNYSLSGEGIFSSDSFKISNGESIHNVGLCRASGLPLLAGLIMLDEVLSGEINHKIAFANRYNSYQEYTYPAIWTDGRTDNGVPEGAVFQLDPDLDLSSFSLTKAEIVIAKALQKYGMVSVDHAGGNIIYAQGFYGTESKKWSDLIRPCERNKGINSIPIKHFRMLKMVDTIKNGDKYK